MKPNAEPAWVGCGWRSNADEEDRDIDEAEAEAEAEVEVEVEVAGVEVGMVNVNLPFFSDDAPPAEMTAISPFDEVEEEEVEETGLRDSSRNDV